MTRRQTTRLVLLGAMCVASATLAGDVRPIAEVRSLPFAALAVSPEVRIRGVVTFRGNTELIVQDDSGGLYVHFRGAAQSGLWESDGPPDGVGIGDDVEIVGVAFDADVSPGFWPKSVVNHGPTALPEIREAGAEWFFGGGSPSEIIAFSGIVHRVRDADTFWRIILEADARPFSAFIAKDVLAAALGREAATITERSLTDLLVDAVVRVSGPTTLRTHNRDAWFEPQVNVGRADWFTVIDPPRQAPFDAPLVPLAMLGRQWPWPVDGRRVRVSGVVVHAIPGTAVFLQDDARAVRVETTSAERFAPGDRVEAAGFVARRGQLSGLADALVRKVGTADPPPAVDLEPPLEESFSKAEGRLVRLTASLLDVRPTIDGTFLTLSTSSARVSAVVPPDAAVALRRMEPGAVLSITGIAETSFRFDEPRWPVQVPDQQQLTVRSAADVRVVRPAPWWTPGRLATLLGLAAAALLGALAWTMTLQRRLRLQTAKLATEMRSRRDAAVEFAATLQERNRLAANLHDTLLQTLGGIGYQLDACEGSRTEDETETRVHFDVARRMVNHAAGELHNAVWAMRSLPIREPSFPAALAAVVGRVGEGHPATIEIRTHGQLDNVPEFVAGNLLLIVQEAVHNALRHGRPRNILVEVEAQAASRSIRAMVRDDGAGFAAAADAGPENRGAEAGHFGLLGMRERAERLGGSFRIESTPGHGTTVTAEVRRSEFDEELEEPLSTGHR